MADPLDGSFGPFRVRADLGQGRFGRHYRGEAGDGGDPVVIRTFTARLEPPQRQALLEALEWLCETPLDHQAIAVPLACGVEGEVPFLVHAFAPGAPFDEFLDRRGPQPFDEVVVRLTQLGGAIDFAAAAGVHHGALHQRDILLGPQGAAIVGFGLAQAASQAGVNLETHGPYESPQRRVGEPVTHADDVYALAVVALQMLCGTADGSQGARALLDLLRQEGLSDDLASIFEAAVSEDPRERPATALAFAAALQTAVGHAGDAARASAAAVSGDTASPPPLHAPVQDFGASRPSQGADPGELSLLLEFMPEGQNAPRASTTPDDVAAWRQSSPPPTGGRQSAPQATAGTTQLPLELMFSERTNVAFQDVDLRDVDDHAHAATVVTARAGEPDVFRTLADDRDAGLSGWVARVATVAVVGVLAGVAVIYVLSRTTGSVPFPGSAAPASSAPSSTSTAPSSPSAGGSAPESGGLDDAVRSAPTVVANDPPVVASIPEPISEPVPGSSLRDADARTADVSPATPPARPIDPAAAAPTASPDSTSGAPQASRGVPVSAPGAEPGVSAPRRPPPPVDPAPLLPGRILVRSTPAGAQVSVNGLLHDGRTPLPVRDLPIGAHTIVVTHPSYGSREERVTLTAAAPAQSIDFDFGQAAPSSSTTTTSPPPGPVASPVVTFGAVYVESRPAGAQVFVDDRLVGTTPILLSEVEAGPHRVRLEMSGYRQWSTLVTVTSGAHTRVAASLER